ncbi:MAG: hypothetical protein M0R51_17595 [Clostridia bacterium]|jgi:hypothetical protein|nr:hypothetical protein [Clostridia bacterium]
MKAHIINGSSRKNLDEMRRLFKIVCVVLHNHGYGTNRLNQIIGEIGELAEQAKSDEIFWEHTDKLLIDKIKIDFERENYEEMDK